MKNTLLKYYTAALYLCSTFVLFAQPGTEDTGGPGSLESTDPAAPIDDYVWILVLMGLVYVFFKVGGFQKNKIQG